MLKSSNIKFILFPILVAAMLAVILFIIFANGQPKVPAAAEQVFSALESNGFIGADITGDYREKWNIGSKLKSAVACEDNDIRFDFFIFDSDKKAEAFRKQYQSYIMNNRYSTPNIKVSEGSANYMLYTIKANGLYTINMRVADTLVFAYCNEENAEKLNAVMRDIGYFDN